MGTFSGEITPLLHQAARGEPEAREQLFRRVEVELKVIAASLLTRERAELSLQPTLLVDEIYLRLIGNGKELSWADRKHFFRTAARAMRRMLIDHARRGRLDLQPLDSCQPPAPAADSRLAALEEALARLAQLDPRAAQVVELHSFAGRTIQETAELLDISVGTVKNDWAAARAWLHRELTRE
jgi:RNA polymerase sigma factor (TIGR02999 family)